VVDVVVEVVTGLVEQFRPRQLHALRDGAPADPARDRGHRFAGQPSALQPRGAAPTFFYRSAAGVEPSRVGPHDDYRP